MTHRNPAEINQEYQAAAAALGQATYHKAKLEGQIAHLAQRMAQLEDEHAALLKEEPVTESKPPRGAKAAAKRAAAMAKAAALTKKAQRGKRA